MHRIHKAFTVAAPIAKGQSGNLSILLKSLKDKHGNCLIDFEGSDTTLFASCAILPEQNYHGEMLPETLVFATTFTGPRFRHIKDLVQTCKSDLCKIFSHCENFPKRNLIKDETLADYLRSNHNNSAFNSRYNCITKKEVKKEKELRHEIENYIDKAQNLKAFDTLPARQVKSLIQRHIVTRGDDYEWCHKPAEKSFLELMIINRGPIITLLLFTLLLWLLCRRPRYRIHFLAIAAVSYLLLYATLKYISSQKNLPAERQDDSKVRQQAATQLHPILNEMVATSPLKKGRLRRFFYSAALRAINWFAPFLMQIPTISNIRWLAVNNKKRLLFLSTYSNTTDFYVRDFLNGATPRGVNFMFTNGEGFPDATMLLYDGIKKDPEGYMNAVHLGQLATDLWYAHEPNLTSDIINKNRKIRNGLFRHMSEEQAKEWLKLF